MFKTLVSNVSGLQNYWPIVNGTTKDIIGGADAFCNGRPKFSQDQFNSSKSALRVSNNHSFFAVPPGIYFSGDFTVTVWCKVYSFGFWNRFIDFSVNGTNSNNIIISLSYGLNSLHHHNASFSILNDGNENIHFGVTELPYNKWFHLATVLKGTTSFIYVNGILDSDKFNVNIPKNVTRYMNYIGKSPWSHDAYANADFDEIKIFNRALDASEIRQAMMLNSF